MNVKTQLEIELDTQMKIIRDDFVKNVRIAFIENGVPLRVLEEALIEALPKEMLARLDSGINAYLMSLDFDKMAEEHDCHATGEDGCDCQKHYNN